MGDAIREEYASRNGVEPKSGFDSDALGEFAASWRDEASHEIPETVADIASRYYRGLGKYQPEQSDLLIIDGVRSPTDFEVLNGYFDEFYLIDVDASFYTRLDRLRDRGRDSEDEFDAVDLAERDQRERNDLDYGDLIEQERPHLQLENPRGEGRLRPILSNIVKNNLPFETADDEPLLTVVGGKPIDTSEHTD
jgi:hypothetical protein